jgi:hypothetical protein
MASGQATRARVRQAVAPRAAARLHRVVLDDHVRLPSRFFGRLTAAVLAGL